MKAEINGNHHDPYADVRDRMERLASADKELHTSMEHATAANKSISENMPLFIALTSYIGYAVLIAVGHFRDLVAGNFRHGRCVLFCGELLFYCFDVFLYCV